MSVRPLFTNLFKPYPTYKPSGVPWLGDVPAHWELRRTKTVLRERKEKGFPNEPLLAATQTKGVVRKEQYENRTVLALKGLHLLKLVRVGDFVISLRSFQGGIEYAREQGIISPAYTILYPRNPAVHAYLAWLFKSRTYIENLTLHVTGIRQGQNIDYSELGRSYLPLPPLPEQRAIVRYLDHAADRIQRYVTAKRKLIALLEEEKQAVVNQAVTRGLDPNVRLKPSGVEWLGDVPAHWKVRPVKRAFTSMDYGISASASDSGSIRLLTMGHLNDGRVIVPDDGGVDFVAPHLLLQSGDLLFNRTNSQELVGKVGLFVGYDTPVTFASYLVRMRPNPSHEPEYLNMALNGASFMSRARREAILSLHQSNLNPTRFGRIHIALPSKEEQCAILHALQKKTASLGAAIVRARCQIELVEEYRIRLIADVVTGKLDVREAAARLPDESGHQGPVEEGNPMADGMDEEIYDAEEEPAIAEEVRI